MSYNPKQYDAYQDIPAEKFQLAYGDQVLGEKKLETKPKGFFKDAMDRFSRNKASVVCFCILVVLAIYAIVAPIVSPYGGSTYDGYYSYSLPRNEFFVAHNLGVWDGCYKQTMNQQTYDYYSSIPGAIVEVYDTYEATVDAGRLVTYYDVKLDSYAKVGYVTVLLTASEYQAVLDYQDETGIQLLQPIIDDSQVENQAYKSDANAWYKSNSKGVANRDADGNLQDIYLRDDNGDLCYYITKMNGNQYQCRVLYSDYYYYLNGFHASFLFGADKFGYDIFGRLALGARLSLVLSVLVAAVNLCLGIVVGALEGYYGGWFDLLFERVKDIIWEIPTVVFMSLFQIYFAKKLGPVVALFFCFVAFGWISTSSTVRAQFYRFKGQEYVLAARTLGAKDNRLIFRHILPNAAGFIITTSVLSIPGVIFSEANMTYLGIVNLQSTSLTSVGTMLNNGQDALATYPHCIFFPAAFISVLLISFNIFGNGLRDAFNPSLRGADE